VEGPALSEHARLAGLVTYVVALFFAFPHPLFGGVLDLGWLLAWLAPGFFHLGLLGRTPKNAAKAGFLAAWAAQSAILHWIYVVTVQHGHAPVVVGVLAPILLALYTAPFFAVFAALHAWFEARGLRSPWVVALLWTALDHARGFVLTGWPWATLGYAQHENEWLLGLTRLTGVYGLSFVSVLFATALADFGLALYRQRPLPRISLATSSGLAILPLSLLVGFLLRAPAPPVEGPTLRVAAVQGNIEQGVKWSPQWADRILDRYRELSLEAAAQGAELIVWPETSMPGFFQLQPEVRERIEKLARETDASLVIGGMGIRSDPATGQITEYHDSAFLVEPDGRLADRYDKSHLVPFGEYLPLRALLGRFVGAVATGIAATDVSPGPGPVAFDLALPLRAADSLSARRPLRVGVPICYELLFPHLVRGFADDGAALLLAITNDAWYGRTGAPYQFLAMTALRSAETGLWTLRAANTGVSAIIDARGGVRDETPIFEAKVLVGEVPVTPPPKTFYTRFGDVFAWLCWMALAGALLLASRMRVPGEGSER